MKAVDTFSRNVDIYMQKPIPAPLRSSKSPGGPSIDSSDKLFFRFTNGESLWSTCSSSDLHFIAVVLSVLSLPLAPHTYRGILSRELAPSPFFFFNHRTVFPFVYSAFQTNVTITNPSISQNIKQNFSYWVIWLNWCCRGCEDLSFSIWTCLRPDL